MPVALTGVHMSGSPPIARLPSPATDVRLPIQMVQAARGKHLYALDQNTFNALPLLLFMLLAWQCFH